MGLPPDDTRPGGLTRGDPGPPDALLAPLAGAAGTVRDALLDSGLLPHMPFATSIADATDSLVFMAVDPSIEGVGGKMYVPRALYSLRMSF